MQESTPDTAILTESSSITDAILHGRTSRKRRRTAAILQKANVSHARLLRYNQCGYGAWIMRSVANEQKYKILANRCHDRFCPTCNRIKSGLLAQRLSKCMELDGVRFVTLTLLRSSDGLKKQIDRIYKYYAKLRRWKAWSCTQTASISFLETKFNFKAKQWHTHLHILTQGTFLPQKELSNKWKYITGDSYIVDIRAIKSKTEAVNYVTKYASKGVSMSALGDDQAAIEAIHALSGRRLIISTGNWKQIEKQDEREEKAEWTPVCSLAKMIERAMNQEPEAIEIINLLLLRKGGKGTCIYMKHFASESG